MCEKLYEKYWSRVSCVQAQVLESIKSAPVHIMRDFFCSLFHFLCIFFFKFFKNKIVRAPVG
jgi:hypothetical protein